MNRKQLAILVVLLVVVGGAGLFLRNRENSSWTGSNPAMGKKLLENLPVNDVAQITLKQGTNELTLAKKDDLWRVRERGDYPANYSEISDFLLKARDLKILQTEKVGPSQLPKLGLASGQGTNSALIVDLKDQSGKVIKSLTLGKKHMKKSNRPSPMGDMGDDAGWPDGRWVKAGNDSETAVLISEPLANLDPKPEQWLSKDFFRIEKPRSIAVTFPAATNSWKLTRETETGEWKLADAKPTEQLDTAKASGVSNPFSSPSFSDVLINSSPETTGLDKPTTITVDTFEDLTYTVKVGQKANDNFPLAVTIAGQVAKERTPGKEEKPEDKAKLDQEFKAKQKKIEEKLTQEKACEKWIYLVSTWTVEPLLKERGQLMAEKKEEPKPGDKPAAATPAASDSALEPLPGAEAKPEPK